MPKKYLNYLLIVAVLTVWGTIFYRYFKPNDKPQKDIGSIPISYKEHPISIQNRKHLEVSKKNPFALTQVVKKSEVRNFNNKPSKRQKNTSKPTRTPKRKRIISYHGIVIDERGNKSFVLKERSNLFQLTMGEELSGISVLEESGDSIALSVDNVRMKLPRR